MTDLKSWYRKNLSIRAQKVIYRLVDGISFVERFSGSTTVEDILDVTEDELMCMKNCGESTTREIMNAIKVYVSQQNKQSSHNGLFYNLEMSIACR